VLLAAALPMGLLLLDATALAAVTGSRDLFLVPLLRRLLSGWSTGISAVLLELSAVLLRAGSLIAALLSPAGPFVASELTALLLLPSGAVLSGAAAAVEHFLHCWGACRAAAARHGSRGRLQAK
jgi:hypothetical protein